MPLNIIIFSYNRPQQLELLLRTLELKTNGPATTSVVWNTDDYNFYGPAYSKVFEEYSFAKSVYEPENGGFKQSILKQLEEPNPYTMFLVDDIFFKDNWDIQEACSYLNNQTVLCHSLRLYPGIDYCYPTKQQVKAPQTANQGIWQWFGCEGDWGYPMSVDGHIFRTDFIKQVATVLDYQNPNSFEASMANIASQFGNYIPNMTCYTDNSKIINVPANRVQNLFPNRVGNLFSPKELNDLFLKDKRIDVSDFDGYKNRAPHEELIFKLR